MNKIKIKKGNIYKILNSPSLNKKYNQGQILIQIEDRDKVVFGDTWNNRQHIPAVVAFMFRQIDDSIFEKYVLPRISNDQSTFLLVIDNLRFDQWRVIQPLLDPYFSTKL